jgi:hypothetical protein
MRAQSYAMWFRPRSFWMGAIMSRDKCRTGLSILRRSVHTDVTNMLSAIPDAP